MGKRYFPWLLGLAGLFLLRVLAQLIQAVHPISFIPPFQAWHGAVMPYPVLVMSQVVIIIILAVILVRVKTDAISPSRWKYRVCFTIGGVYFIFMAFRLLAGLTFLGDHAWFSKHLPAFFHIVLASFVLLLGHYIFKTAVGEHRARESGSKLVAAVSYPATILLGFAIFLAAGQEGMPVAVASYSAVLIAAAVITLHELKLPYRSEWKPSGGEIGADFAFMMTVQIAIPYLLAISVVVALSDYLKANGIAVQTIWPHDQFVGVQVCLMLLIADFPRYWMHRAFHKFTPMWRFHAVHHSPHRLYWLNVGRFHPIEKAIQYSVDALPFALLGVSVEVLSAYFVFFAINGFYQHSNCRVSLGPLNYIVSGPELHRWHHSELASESDTNFGNNLILWDLLFATRFLPKDRDVGPLGLVNRTYPTGFLAQMKTPFVRGLEGG